MSTADTLTPLERWLGPDRGDKWLAERLNCSQSQASRIRRGVSRPSPERAFEIERLTEGAVTAERLLTDPLLSEAAA